MSRLHENLLEHIRGFAVHGDEYARSYAAHSLLRDAPDGTRDLQRRAFDLLAGAGVFTEDEPLELHRSEIEEDFPKPRSKRRRPFLENLSRTTGSGST